MQLIGYLDSPFVRRVAITMRSLGIDFDHCELSIFRDFEEKFDKIQSGISTFENILDDLYSERQYDDLLDALSNVEFDDKKLTKKARKEKEEKCSEFIKKKYPQVSTLITELDTTLDAIGFLIKEGTISVESTSQSEKDSKEIPKWIKNNAKWWAEGAINDDAFIQGIEFLVKAGVIPV